MVIDSLGYSVHWMGDATEMEQVIGIKVDEDLNRDLVWDTLKRHEQSGVVSKQMYFPAGYIPS